jgi:hypothetical protein
MQYGVELANTRRAMGELLLRSLEDPGTARANPTKFITAIEQAGYTFLPAINDSTFEEIKFAGRLGIIQNEQLRRSIAAYYKLIERYDQWGYLRESFQVAYSDAGIGILTAEQLAKIEPVNRYSDPERTNAKWEFTIDDAEQALERIRSKQEFIDQIPRATLKGIEIGNTSTWLGAAIILHDDINQELGRATE